MEILRKVIEPLLGDALEELGINTDYWKKSLSQSRERDQGDLSLPCFSFAKEMSKDPNEIAKKLAEILSDKCNVHSVGGYLNFRADKKWLAAEVIKGFEHAGESNVLIEHTSANPNGPFHVGRARNAILGDSLVRLHRYYGNIVRSEYYVDDMGKQVGVLAWALDNLTKEKVDQILNSNTDSDSRWEGKSDHETVKWYQAAQLLRQEGDQEIESEISRMVHASENGDDTVLSKFEDSYSPVLDGMLATLSRLGIEFDTFTKESKFVVDGSVSRLMEAFENLEIVGTADNGAKFLDLGQRGLKGKTEFFYRRGDGSSLYATRDIAYHIWKWGQCDKLINVLGEDHKLQSKQVGLTLQELGYKVPEVMFYAFIKLPEGKMSTRRGNVVYMDDLLEEAKEHAAKIVRDLRSDLSEEEINHIAEAVGVSAVRFNIIKVSPDKGFTFRWEEALSFEGESAPFVMYSHTRACSIAKKVGRKPSECEIGEIGDSMYELLRIMAINHDRLSRAVNGNKPHIYATQMLELATAYNAFYRDCHVINEGVVNEFNFCISERARVMLEQGMNALGVIPLESM
ncbi:MAG: arginine--tRNA ligase [Candidatus Poseidoniaceae archaeon]|jgi:arginyl-tRNA synthetase|nr:arginine--tRNA ligase [Candidatus Poseidoniaceae archaeon]